MKKMGFTLTEILITLGIIGVVAAITIPSLFNNTSTGKIGPTLAKAVASFERANKSLLAEKSADALSDTGVTSSGSNYFVALAQHFNGTLTDSNTIITTKDGVGYQLRNSATFPLASNSANPSGTRLGYLLIDINGFENSPNADASDRFYFDIQDDGSLLPWGRGDAYKTSCPNGAIPTNATMCAGSIFANNLKVMYK